MTTKNNLFTEDHLFISKNELKKIKIKNFGISKFIFKK